MPIYRAKPLDTYADIAVRFGLTVEALMFANPQITDSSVINVGDFIYIPVMIG